MTNVSNKGSPFFISVRISSSDSRGVFFLQRVRHQFKGSLRMRHDLLNSLQLFLHWINCRVFSHDVAVIRGVWSANTSLEK